jgi:hypothetical protein
MSTSETVIVLGAGASAAEGAPIQSTLFRDYFKSYRSKAGYEVHHSWDRELATFFEMFFGIDVDAGDLDRTDFPTFEEVLGILEIAGSQDDSFRAWPGVHLINNGTSRIQHIHDILVFLIAEILHEKLGRTGKLHRQLVRSLERAGWLDSAAFISFNYDILIDNGLLDERGADGFDYSVPFVNQNQPAGRRRPTPLFKLHGSLNWLYCSTCRDLQVTPHEKGVMRLKWEPEKAVCQRCENPRSPIVIPPTFFKVLSNLLLRNIWDEAERECLSARRLVFCGYSFPDADIHVRYLLKRMEVNGGTTPEVFVVNNHPGKASTMIDQERWRYQRFFINKRSVHYTNLSFEDFTEEPRLIEDSSRWLS